MRFTYVLTDFAKTPILLSAHNHNAPAQSVMKFVLKYG